MGIRSGPRLARAISSGHQSATATVSSQKRCSTACTTNTVLSRWPHDPTSQHVDRLCGAQPSRTTVLDGVSYSWAQTIVWGNTVVWRNTIAVNQRAWAVAIMWGTTSLWSTTVVWGNNVVWESPQVWCRTIVWGNHAIGTSDGSAIMWGTTDLLAPDTVAWGDLRR